MGKRIRDKWRARARLGNRGAAAIEYALLAALIALAIVASLMKVERGLESTYNAVDHEVSQGTKFEV